MHCLKIVHERCVGCRTCELACSYHHTQAFSPGKASLEIRGEDDQAAICITFFEDMSAEEKKERVPCDHCGTETLPFCVKYCPVGAIKVKGGAESP